MPVAEYCTVFRVSTPMVLDALPMTVRASCADAVQTRSAASASPSEHPLNIVHRLSRANCTPECRIESGMADYKPQQLDKKWQQEWTASNAFEVQVDAARPKF